ncbi:MAG: outer rane biosis protein BamB [Schlesneria sp.]|nr:outer rane biosis protein BamB [Schlesneria sp.]
MYRLLSCCLVIVAITGVVRADDWPQWLGPTRDSVWHEKGIVDKFPESGLKVKWRVPVSLGYAGPAVVGDRVYITDYVRESGDVSNSPNERRELKGIERVLCLNANDGKPIWEHSDKVTYKISYPSGPRATPTVADGKVYTLGAEGLLLCLNEKDGKPVWSKDFKKEYKIDAPIWGFCAAPMVDGKKLICLAGGEGSVAVAFDKDTGKELWRALSASEPGYCPPSIIEAGGKRQLIIWSADDLNGLDPDTGKVHWTQPIKPSYGMSIAVPQHHGNLLFVSGIGSVAAVFKLKDSEPAAEVVWRATPKTAVFAANTTPVIDDDGIIYGADCMSGQFRAVKLDSGDRLWDTFAPTTNTRRGGHGTAFIVRNEDKYFLFSETGDLILAKLSASKYDEISRFHVLEPTGECFGREVVWSAPAYANKCCFARNDKELVCVSLEK